MFFFNNRTGSLLKTQNLKANSFLTRRFGSIPFFLGCGNFYFLAILLVVMREGIPR